MAPSSTLRTRMAGPIEQKKLPPLSERLERLGLLAASL